ncbi:Protein PCP-3 [Aphelenchoides avenae]|nr:Protein PCP-3 [Aphelenchus avenae]
MRLNAAFLLAVTLCSLFIESDAHSFRRRMINGRPLSGFRKKHLNKEQERELIAAAGKGDQWFTQKLDHFDSSNTVTWQQRYFVNDKYYKPGGPIFLIFGQEGPSGEGEILYEPLPEVTWAKKLNAMIFSLEHRFYGKSRPFPQQTTDKLKYLTSRQNLEDLAYFIKTKNNELKLTNPQWVVFGGSYSGSCVLWFRKLYPDLTVGGVGSSGPVQAALDFYDYFRVVEDSLRTYDPQCSENVRTSFNALQQYMDYKAGRASLTSLFTLDPTFESLNLTYEDLENFYSTVMGNFAGAVQYSRVNAGYYATEASIPDVCKIMLKPSGFNPLYKLVEVNTYLAQVENYGDFEGTDNSYTGMIQYLQNPNYDAEGDYSASRSWTWQTCNEFGYFQSTDLGGGIFGSTLPNNFYIDMCSEVFGPEYNLTYVKNAVDATNKHYGGRDNYNGTNVVIPNGSLDPWHALGLYEPLDPTAVVYLINGTAHCADMEPPSPNDVPGLAVVRDLIFENIQRWVGNVIVEGTTQSSASAKEARSDALVNEESAKKTTAVASEVVFGQDVAEQMPVQLLVVNEEHKRRAARLNRRYGRSPNGFILQGEADSNPSGLKPSVPGWIRQNQDHFDPMNANTWKQRFWVNDEFNASYTPGGNGEVIFLMLGGESAANPVLLNADWAHMRYAQQYGAVVYLLEHRYYGKSRPTATLSTDNLKYLSSEQALADAAVFIRTINKYKGYVNPKWVTFGGSYSGKTVTYVCECVKIMNLGALSAWFRELYPELTVGAVGSSGPVLAKTDFFEYLQVVQASLNNFNPQCTANIKEGLDNVHNLLQTIDGRTQLNALSATNFVCRPWKDSKVDPLDVLTFVGNLIGMFMGAVQYSGDNMGQYASGFGIRDVCNIMLDTSQTPLQNLVAVNRYLNYGGDFCVDNNYKQDIAYMKLQSFDSPAAGIRAWVYQTCTEFGYFQSTDMGQNAFGSAYPVNIFVRTCMDVYGPTFNRTFIDAGVQRSLKKYGGVTNYKGTNVALPNGSHDPWHALGLYVNASNNNNGTVTSILIDGTAHCADMYPARQKDVAGLTQARQTISGLIGQWLGN